MSVKKQHEAMTPCFCSNPSCGKLQHLMDLDPVLNFGELKAGDVSRSSTGSKLKPNAIECSPEKR